MKFILVSVGFGYFASAYLNRHHSINLVFWLALPTGASPSSAQAVCTSPLGSFWRSWSNEPLKTWLYAITFLLPCYLANSWALFCLATHINTTCAHWCTDTCTHTHTQVKVHECKGHRSSISWLELWSLYSKHVENCVKTIGILFCWMTAHRPSLGQRNS